MASGIYNRFKWGCLVGDVDLPSDTINCALMDSSHSFDGVNDDIWADISINEISGTGYTADGITLAGKSAVQATTSYFDATDVAWTASSFVAAHAVVWNGFSDDLICSFDFSGDQTVIAGTFTIQWHATGIITLT